MAHRTNDLRAAITRLAALFPFGALQADTDPVGFLGTVAEEIQKLRAGAPSAPPSGDPRDDDLAAAPVATAAMIRAQALDEAAKVCDGRASAHRLGSTEQLEASKCASTIRYLADAPPSGDDARAPWYLADGSTVMLPAEEVTRRRKLAAKVIEAARKVVDFVPTEEGYALDRTDARILDALTEASDALDAASPSAGSKEDHRG